MNFTSIPLEEAKENFRHKSWRNRKLLKEKKKKFCVLQLPTQNLISICVPYLLVWWSVFSCKLQVCMYKTQCRYRLTISTPFPIMQVVKALQENKERLSRKLHHQLLCKKEREREAFMLVWPCKFSLELYLLRSISSWRKRDGKKLALQRVQLRRLPSQR